MRDAKAYFLSKWGEEISDDQAQMYLLSLARLYAVMVKTLESSRASGNKGPP